MCFRDPTVTNFKLEIGILILFGSVLLLHLHCNEEVNNIDCVFYLCEC